MQSKRVQATNHPVGRILLAVLCIAGVFLSFPHLSEAARLYTSGFEWQSATAGIEFDTVLGTPSITTSIKHSGAASMNINGITAFNAEGTQQPFTANQNTFYARAYVYIDDMENNAGGNDGFWLDATTPTNQIAAVQINNNAGTLQLTAWYNDGLSQISDTASLSFDTWHRIEMYVNTADAAGQDDYTVMVDGVQVANATNLTFTVTDATILATYMYNESGSTDSTTNIYYDDLAFNDTNGASQISWPGAGNIVALVPNAAGDNNCTSGDYTMVNEIPPSDTVTDAVTVCRLNTSGDIADFNVTDSSSAGIDSYDTITLVQPMARMREVITTGAPSGYQLRLKSASGGTATTSASSDASNATTVRTNPNGNAAGNAFAARLIATTDPTSATAWTPTGTNSIDNMQIGVTSTDSDPDFYVVTYAAMVEYVDGSPPPVTRFMRLLGNLRLLGNVRLLGL